jgi:hypothetical protein
LERLRVLSSGRSGSPFYDRDRSFLSGSEALDGFDGEAGHYRAILSPADGWALGVMNPLVRECMSEIELHLGDKLSWFAVDHHDTPHPHSHIVLSMRTSRGDEVAHSETALRRRLQRSGERVISRALGAGGSESESASGRMSVELFALDAELARRARSGGTFVCDQADLLIRLESLETRSLARRRPGGRWSVAPDLSDRLADHDLRTELETRLAARIGSPEGLLLRADGLSSVSGLLRVDVETDPFLDRRILILETGSGDFRWTAVRIEEAPLLLAPEGLVAFLPDRSGGGVSALSLLSLEQQVRAPHLTYLDRVMAGQAPSISGTGPLAVRFRSALEMRRSSLQVAGWIRADETAPGESALRALARREVQAWTERLSAAGRGRDSALSVGDRRLSLAQGDFELSLPPGGEVRLSPVDGRSQVRSMMALDPWSD